MEMNKNSWIASYYRRFWEIRPEGNLPVSLCEFFWKMILGLICFPLVWPGFALLILDRSYFRDFRLISFLLGLVSIPFGFMALIPFDAVPFRHHFLAAVLALQLVGLGVIALLVLIGIGIGILKENLRKRGTLNFLKFGKGRTENQHQESWIKEGWKAFLGRYCPKIHWK